MTEPSVVYQGPPPDEPMNVVHEVVDAQQLRPDLWHQQAFQRYMQASQPIGREKVRCMCPNIPGHPLRLGFDIGELRSAIHARAVQDRHDTFTDQVRREHMQKELLEQQYGVKLIRDGQGNYRTARPKNKRKRRKR